MFKKSKISLKNSTFKPDIFLLTLTIGLTIFGLIMVGNASVTEAYNDFGDKLYYFRLQLKWAVMGALAFLGTLFFNYKFLKNFAFPLLIATIIFLIIVLLPGVGIKAYGAKRWLAFGGFNFQPSELAKFSFILWSAAYLSKNKKSTVPFLCILCLIALLIVLQPDLGTTIILVISGLSIYLVSGASIWKIGLFCLIGLIGGTGLIFSSSYRKERFLTFLNPLRDPLGSSYHIRQILIALGSGGIWGVGLGQSRQKYEYLPMVATDSIFAIIAEEIGFIGSTVLLLAFLVFVFRALKIAKEAPDNFSQLLAVGITSWIGSQVFVNLASIVALLPLTGIPLPFISYGGSSLFLTLMAVGILINISKYRIIKK